MRLIINFCHPTVDTLSHRLVKDRKLKRVCLTGQTDAVVCCTERKREAVKLKNDAWEGNVFGPSWWAAAYLDVVLVSLIRSGGYFRYVIGLFACKLETQHRANPRQQHLFPDNIYSFLLYLTRCVHFTVILATAIDVKKLMFFFIFVTFFTFFNVFCILF